MKINRSILITGVLPLIALTCQPSFGEVIALACKDTTDGFTVDFVIDTERLTGTANGKKVRDVFVDKTTIIFTLDMPRGIYFHTISRSTGNLTVQQKDGGMFSGYSCERAQQKF